MSESDEKSFLIPDIEQDGGGFPWILPSSNEETRCQVNAVAPVLELDLESSRDREPVHRIRSYAAVTNPIRDLIELYEKAKSVESGDEKIILKAFPKNALENLSAETKSEDLEAPSHLPVETMEDVILYPASSEIPLQEEAQPIETDDDAHVNLISDLEYVNRHLSNKIDVSEEAFEKTLDDSEFKHVLKTAAKKAKNKNTFQKILREITDFIPTAFHKAVGDVKDAVGELAREFVNVTKHAGSEASKELKLETSPESRVQIVRDDQELKQKLIEAGNKVVIAFICLDSILTREVVNGKFLPRFEEMAAQNDHLTFLTISERDLSSIFHTPSARWNVPSFIVFQNGIELKKLSIEVKDMKNYLNELEAKLQALIHQYNDVAFDPKTLTLNWRSLFTRVDYETKYQISAPGSLLAMHSFDMLKQYLEDAESESRIVVLTLFPLIRELYFRKDLKTLENMAAQNSDMSFIFAFLRPEALPGPSDQKMMKVLFYKSSKVVYGENWDEIDKTVFQVGTLDSNLISKFKADSTVLN